jgi:hypothetical protein
MVIGGVPMITSIFIVILMWLIAPGVNIYSKGRDEIEIEIN